MVLSPPLWRGLGATYDVHLSAHWKARATRGLPILLIMLTVTLSVIVIGGLAVF